MNFWHLQFLFSLTTLMIMGIALSGDVHVLLVPRDQYEQQLCIIVENEVLLEEIHTNRVFLLYPGYIMWLSLGLKGLGHAILGNII